ncbi:MAG TPA: hypothetical protein ENJ97_08495 [Planctomycetes bacterium]|nr:hypothetical protein [Planctomycetota bacterium]
MEKKNPRVKGEARKPFQKPLLGNRTGWTLRAGTAGPGGFGPGGRFGRGGWRHHGGWHGGCGGGS